MRIVHRIIRISLLLGLLVSSVGCGAIATPAAGLGQPAPDFSLPSLDTTAVRLSDVQGQVVVVNFWASWCPPCVNETPRLVQWQAQHGDAGLQVIGVDTLFQDSLDAVEEFVAEQQVSYPILLDEKGDVSKQWSARQLPRSFVVDRSGVVRYIRIGELTEDDLQRHILPLLSEP